MSGAAIVAYGAYLPAHRLPRAEIGGGKGSRVVASYDEDSTTMGVAAALAALPAKAVPGSVHFATTSPAYADKTNATAIHAALGLPPDIFAADLAGSARCGIAALRAASASGGLAVLSDVRVGLSGSADERLGGDGAAAFLFGDPAEAIAEVTASASVTAEFLDRWRTPGEATGRQWEARFGLETYLPLVEDVAKRALADADVDVPDHVVITSPNHQLPKQVAARIPGRLSTEAGSPIGHAGAADAGLALAAALDAAGPGETILLLSAADGADGIVLRTTDAMTARRVADPVRAQLDRGREVSYLSALSWRGLLTREAPRRPEPEAPAAPPSARAQAWKFGLTGGRCTACGFVQLPPARVCKDCAAVDRMEPVTLSRTRGTVATYTADRLAFSPSPPLIDAVVDFDGGGRSILELADCGPGEVAVGTRVAPTFRRLHTTNGVHNYFWKVRPLTAKENA